ncbi:HNH endonuclease [Candidatus Bathyarchaeota archaeon]|nr:HNH endonuclease [Candidatus Bathyarchaeota archaeon]
MVTCHCEEQNVSRTEIAERLHEIQGKKCFICGRPIDLNSGDWQIDHIVPRAAGGKDEPQNFALTHEICNKKKLDSDLRVARCMFKYEEMKEKYGKRGFNHPNLGDFLEEFGGAKYPLKISKINDEIEYEFWHISTIKSDKSNLYKDALSGLNYSFISLPIEYIYHDDRINPRAIGSRVKGLIEEFLHGRPQLHVSLAWTKIEHGKAEVKVFDGQHKIAAQLLLGVREFPLRVFLVNNEKDLDLLLVTNTRAGTVLRQVAFDMSVQRFLGSQIYWEKIDQYRQLKGLEENDLSFSEKDLITFFKGEHRELKKYIIDDVRTYVIHSPENKLKDYIEFGGRAAEKPLSYSTIEKTFFTFFINKEPLETPLSYKLEVGENPRQLEKEQLIKLMNMFAEEILIGKYDVDIGSAKIEEKLRKGENIPDNHLRAIRLTREEVLYNILRYVRDCIKRYFLLAMGKSVEDKELFQYKFPEQLWGHIRKVIQNIANMPLWINRDTGLSSAIFGGKQSYDYWKTLFDTGKTPQGVAVLPKGLSLDELLT